MALECYVNDLTHQSSQEIYRIGIKELQDLNYILTTLEDSRASLVAKIEATYYILTGNKFDRGNKAHQELSMLIRLRNELVHRKPEPTGEWGVNFEQEFEPHKLVKFFVDRNIIEKPSPNSPPSWSQYLNRPEVAKWAYNVAATQIIDIASWLPGSHLSYIQSFMVKDIEKI